jgi:precorrin-2/cobalt-factor-2 C20-methyltransferase
VAKVYAVGVGPGDPELLTRKAERILRRADVVLAPVSRVGESSVALETVREFLDEGRQEIVIHQFPMTSDPLVLVPAWQEAAALIAARVAAGQDVAFVTIGDPLLYSTFIYLLRILREGYPQTAIEIIPGISSINTAAAAAGIPLVEAEERLAVIPATAGMGKVIEALATFDTVVLLKVKPLYGELLEVLARMGRERSTVFVERVGSPRQKVLSGLAAMAGHSPDYLSLMIVRRP